MLDGRCCVEREAQHLSFVETAFPKCCSRRLRMFEGLFQPMHLVVIFGIALLVFGPKKLPELGKGIGEGIRGFKSAMKAEDEKPGVAALPNDHDHR
jgi:sec-independent protein translocase protein TatA